MFIALKLYQTVFNVNYQQLWFHKLEIKNKASFEGSVNI